ncbi:MAG: hypothetical protein ACYTHJ_18985 [Planctomycetota bacterium]
MNRKSRFARRGMSYMFVMGTSMMVSVIGLSVIALSRIELRTTNGAADAVAARYYAQSAIEIALAEIQLDENWKSSKGDGLWFADESIGGGSMTCTVTEVDDGDGKAENNEVILVGVGRRGRAVHRIEVTLETSSDLGGLRIKPGTWTHVIQ